MGALASKHKVSITTINIPSTLLKEGDPKTRMEHMKDLWASAGCKATFLSATTRSMVVQTQQEVVRLMDGCIGKTLQKALEPLATEWPQIEAIVNAGFSDPGTLKWSLPQDLDKEAAKTLDMALMTKGIAEHLRSKQARAGCTDSHFRALTRAQHQYERGQIHAVLVTEDDICLIHDVKKTTILLGDVMDELATLESWDILLLGASGYKKSKDQTNAQQVAGCTHIVNVTFAYGGFAYIVNGPAIKRVIEIINKHMATNLKARKTIYPQDVVLANCMEKGLLRVYGTVPKLITCIDCFSVICDQDMTYGPVLEEEWTLKSSKI